MGTLENEVRKRVRRGKIEKIILTTIATVGLIGIAALAPNALALLKQLDSGKVRRKRPEYVVRTAIERLKNRGLITFTQEKRGTFIRLTERGTIALAKIKEGGVVFNKPKKWDGKWRMVIFDLPEQRRSVRDNLRRTLLSIGFLKLQNSVWIFPYDCEDLLILLKADFRVGKDILYIIADKIENEEPIKKLFSLK